MYYGLPDCHGVPLDAKLDELFGGRRNGVFIELGAHDGLTQSNTAFLELSRGWTGLLIEPSRIRYEECVRNRPRSTVFHGACVSNSYSGKTVEGDFDGRLMSSVGGERLQLKEAGRDTVPAFTLEALLESQMIDKIDLLSLDTEGYELEVLRGLNLNIYRPHYLLIEVYTKDYESILSFLQSYDYELTANFTNYNRTTNPLWDGSHNDYLFRDSRRIAGSDPKK